MIFFFGSRLFGKVDSVDGLFFVATKFAHIQYLPLIPLGTYLVFETTAEGWRGIPIAFSLKSLAMAWLRALAVVAMAIALALLILFASGPGYVPSGAVIVPIGVCLVSLWLLIGTRYMRGLGVASFARAAQLCRAAGVSEEILNDVPALRNGQAPARGFEVGPPPLPQPRQPVPRDAAGSDIER